LVEPSLSTADVKSRAVAGVAILLGRGVAFRILGLLGNIVLARLLVPEDFGLIAIGLTVVGVGQVLSAAGLGAQLISRAEPPTIRELRAVTGVQLSISSAIAVVAAATCVAVGGDALATAVMMIALPITAIRWAPTMLFSRRMEFSRTVRIEITEIVSYLVVAIGLAVLGFGVWSLAIATVTRSVLGAIVAVRISPAGFVRPTWDPETIRPMLAFGARFQLTSIIALGHEVALIAGMAAIGGLTLVGLWSFASRILQVPFLLFEALFSVGFPTLSRLYGAGEDDSAMKQLVEGLVTVVCIGMAIIMCPIVASAPAAIPLIFGDSWVDVSEILPGAGLAIVMGAPISTVLFGLLYARGDARTALVASVVEAVTRLAITFPLLPVIGAAAIGIGWSASIGTQMIITLAGVRRMIDARLAHCVLPACVLASVAAASGWIVADELGRTIVSMLASAAIGGFGFLLLLAVFVRPQARRAIAMLRSAYRVGRGRSAPTTALAGQRS
jgi:O-antigen/teichoic acid export membrane protein